MTEKEQLAEKEFRDIDAALRRAAQTAKKLAAQNGTPYVVNESKSDHALQEVKSENKQ